MYIFGRGALYVWLLKYSAINYALDELKNIRVFVGTGFFGGHRRYFFVTYGIIHFLAESLSAIPGTAEFQR